MYTAKDHSSIAQKLKHHGLTLIGTALFMLIFLYFFGTWVHSSLSAFALSLAAGTLSTEFFYFSTDWQPVVLLAVATEIATQRRGANQRWHTGVLLASLGLVIGVVLVALREWSNLSMLGYDALAKTFIQGFQWALWGIVYWSIYRLLLKDKQLTD